MKLNEVNPHIRFVRVHKSISNLVVHICYDCRLFFVSKGVLSVECEGKKIELAENSAIYMPPGTEYLLKPLSDDECEVIVFNFDLTNDFAHLSSSLGTANRSNFKPEKILKYDLPEEFSGVISAPLSHYHEPLLKCNEVFLHHTKYYREFASATLKGCLFELLKTATYTPVQKSANKVIEYIHEHFSEADLTNEQIAAVFGYHPYYVSQLMKEATGNTLHHYLLKYRIRMAKNLLITTNYNVADISEKIGFNSVSYFIKTFKTYVGTTPNNYKRKYKDM